MYIIIVESCRVVSRGSSDQTRCEASSLIWWSASCNSTWPGTFDRGTVIIIYLLYAFVYLKVLIKTTLFLKSTVWLLLTFYITCFETNFFKTRSNTDVIQCVLVINFREGWYGIGNPQCGDPENQITLCKIDSNKKGKLMGI